MIQCLLVLLHHGLVIDIFELYIYAALEEGDIRLVGGATDSEGRVEVYHNSVWGTVCDDGWNVTDASVVCRQLGYTRATSAPEAAFFGEGSGPIFYDEVACTGSEARLTDCSNFGFGNHDCSHSEDAGVVCYVIQGLLSSIRHAYPFHYAQIQIIIDWSLYISERCCFALKFHFYN